MKKLLSLLLVTVLLMSCMATMAFADENPEFTASDATKYPGETVTLTVSTSEITYQDYAMYVKYNSEVLTFVGASAGEASNGTFGATNKNPGSVKAAVYGGSNKTTRGELFSVTFTVAADATPGTYPVELEIISVRNEAQDYLTVDIDNGSVTVVARPCAHVNTEVIPGKAATCSETGLTDGLKCTDCGTVLTQQTVIEKLAHTEKIIPGKAASCTEDGLTEGKKCSVCGETIVAQTVITAPGHTEETVPGKAATCTATGLTEGKKCSVCGETIVAQTVIEKLAHTEETIPGKAATCTATGLTDGKKCSVCGEILVAQEEIPMIDHTWSTDDKEATCTEPGVKDGKHCETCGKIVEGTVIDALGHDLKETAAAVAPTCTTAGKTAVQECTRCDHKVGGEEIKALGHTPGKAVEENKKDSTCSKAGSVELVVYCSVCGEEISRTEQTIEKKAHVDANKDDKCDECGAAMDDDEPKNGDITPYPVYFLIVVLAVMATAYGLKRKFRV